MCIRDRVLWGIWPVLTASILTPQSNPWTKELFLIYCILVPLFGPKLKNDNEFTHCPIPGNSLASCPILIIWTFEIRADPLIRHQTLNKLNLKI